MKEYLRAVGYAMITIVAVLFGMGLAAVGYLTAAVYFGLTKGQTAAAEGIRPRRVCCFMYFSMAWT